MDAFEAGRATERERLRLLLETRRSLITHGRGSATRLDELQTVLGMIDATETQLDQRLNELATLMRVSPSAVIARAIGAR